MSIKYPRAGARLRHRPRQAARDRELHHGAGPAASRRGRASWACRRCAGGGRRHRHHRCRHRLGATDDFDLTCTSAPRPGWLRTSRTRRPTSSRRWRPSRVPPRSLPADRPAGHRGRQPDLPARQHPLSQGRAAARGRRPDIFKVLDQIASRAARQQRRRCTRPGSGASAPRWKTACCAPASINISLNNTREDILRAFLEGIALNTRWLLGPVEKFMGRHVDAIHIVGGGATVGRVVPDLCRRDGRGDPPGVRSDLCQRPRRARIAAPWASKRYPSVTSPAGCLQEQLPTGRSQPGLIR